MKKLLTILLILTFAVTLTPQTILAAPAWQGVACEQDVVVQADDWLSKLAEKFYGDVLAFPALVEATNQAHAADDSYARIDNSDIIEPGWKLCVPSTEDAQALLTGQASSALAGAASGEPIVMGASLPLTGGFSVNGQKHKEGYELCADLINQAGGLLGRPLEIIVSDNRSDTEAAISQTERMINVDNVDVLLGTFSSRLTFPVSAIAQQNNMVYPIPAGGALRIYERGFNNLFYFQVAPAEYVGNSPIELLVNRAGGDLPKTAAVVHADDFFANGIANGLIGGEVEVSEGQVIELPSLLADNGIELVYNEQWPEEGFADWITLANSVKNSGAEFLVGLTASPEETVQLTRALQTVGYQPKAVYLSQGTQAEYLEGVGDAANGVMIHAAWHPLAPWSGELAGQPFTNQDFIAAYKAKYGVEPDEDVAIPFALCQGVAQAIAGAGTTDNAAIRDWMHARTEAEPVETILGPFYWNEKGLPIGKSFLMTQWQDGELKFVYPLDEFEGVADFLYPKPEW
jgi:branched-chain amino acid transport system substrate-binding protein